MHAMRSFLHACALAGLAAAMSGTAMSARAGAGTLAVSVEPVSSPVTYSSTSPALTTYLGLQVSLTNAGRNTINHVTVTVTVSATDPAEPVELFDPAFYLPSSCQQTSSAQFTCSILQLKSGTSFPAAPFTVFYKAPPRRVNGTADDAGTDFIRADAHVVYAEGPNGPHSVPQNSIRDFAFPDLVRLVTPNPAKVTSAVPHSGASLFTGTDGIPTATNPATEKASIPTLSVPFAVADIAITDNTADPQCANLGHFFHCPVYVTSVRDGASQEVQFPHSPWLATTYRVAESNLKMSTWKILNSAQLLYTGGIFTDFPVPVCVNSAPNAGAPTDAHPAGVPCIVSSQCIKKDTWGSRKGYCEWNLINTRNGSLKIL
jgi:hypothetical protein